MLQVPALPLKHFVLSPDTPPADIALTLTAFHRLFNVEVPLNRDPGKDDCGVNEAVLSAVAAKLGLSCKGPAAQQEQEQLLQLTDVTVVRKSFDGRWKKDGQPKFGTLMTALHTVKQRTYIHCNTARCTTHTATSVRKIDYCTAHHAVKLLVACPAFSFVQCTP